MRGSVCNWVEATIGDKNAQTKFTRATEDRLSGAAVSQECARKSWTPMLN